MALQDLLAAFKQFDEGVTKFAISSAVTDATKQVNMLNQQQLDEQDKLQAMNQLSTDLALRLTSAGADASQIAAATERIAPSLGQQFQVKAAEQAQKASQTFQRQERIGEQDFRSKESSKERGAASSMMERKFEQQQSLETQEFGRKKSLAQMQIDATREIQAMKLEQAGKLLEAKKEKEVKAGMIKQQDTFFTQQKKNLEIRDAANRAQSVLSNSGTSTAGVGLALTALARLGGEVGTLTDTDIQRAKTDPSFRQDLARRFKLELTGESLKSDVKFYSALLNRLQQDHETVLVQKAKDFGKVRAESLGISPDEFTDKLIQGFGLKKREQQLQQKQDAQNAASAFIKKGQ